MNVVTLSQIQFAMTTIYHFFFVPLTLGLSWLIAVMETLYVSTGKEVFKKMTKFWGKLFLINFAMGVVTGIVQEFQFGMNWAEYSRFVGDIFGAPLAIEALLAFFLESTFLGVWIFGWDKISKRLHLASIWLVAIATNISAFFILVANSFMQNPVGYVIENGRAVMVDFFALLKNYYVWGQFPHMIASGLTMGAFFVMGISAYHLIKAKREQSTDEMSKEVFTRSLRMASYVGLVAAVMVGVVGDLQAKRMVQTQPMKMAAAEALLEDENPASMSIITITDEKNLENYIDLRIPYVGSILAYSRLDGELKGARTLQAQYEEQYGPGDYVPNIFISYWSFRIMVGVGMLMVAIAAILAYLSKTKRELPDKIQIKKFGLEVNFSVGSLYPYILFLPTIAITAGWVLTEMGRQPWIVVGLMKTAEAVSPSITAGMVLTSIIGFMVVYGVLMGVDVYLLKKYARAGIVNTEETHSQEAVLDAPVS
jgi:cytochrome bd ubiquinol oxidase subunit I